MSLTSPVYTYLHACTGLCTSFNKVYLHLRKFLTHTLLFWHFLENLNFEFKTILEFIRTMFSGDACLCLETSDLELLKYGSLSWKLQKTKVTNFPYFKQINTENRIAICHCIIFFMRSGSGLFSKISQFAFYYSWNKMKTFQSSIFFIYKLVQTMRTHK